MTGRRGRPARHLKEVKTKRILTFLTILGLTFEIHSYIDSSCTTDENGMFTGVQGQRRVQNVMAGDEPLDPKTLYTVAGTSYLLRSQGDGFTMFAGSAVVQEDLKMDNQVIIDYITDTLGGTVGDGYENPYGQGRIVIIEE